MKFVYRVPEIFGFLYTSKIKAQRMIENHIKDHGYTIRRKFNGKNYWCYHCIDSVGETFEITINKEIVC